MRIAIAHPTTWPYVRRGTERFINELALYLAQRGHSVTIISSKPGAPRISRDTGYVTVFHRRLWHPLMANVGVRDYHVFPASLLVDLLRTEFDVVHCANFTDAYVASVSRRLTGVPCVFYMLGLPPPVASERSLTLGGAVFRRAVAAADEVVTISGQVDNYLLERCGRSGYRIPMAVDTDRFSVSTVRDHSRPIILCTAALDDPRKGGRLLMEAYNRVKETRPGAVLQVSCQVTEQIRAGLLDLVNPEWRSHVEFLGAGHLDDLPQCYGRAAVSVLPSLWEAFGLVILESLASGTPVVGTRHGAIPELLNEPGIGGMFDPGPTVDGGPSNVEGLAAAILDALVLSAQPATARRCRAYAERYSWGAIGPHFEQLCERLVERKQPGN